MPRNINPSKPRKKRDGRPVPLPVPYKLKLVAKPRDPYWNHATLTSPLLDPILFPKRVAKICFPGSQKNPRKTNPIADRFVRRSLEFYLRQQKVVTAMLQKHLLESRSRWDRKGTYLSGDLWKQSKIELVEFRSKDIWTLKRIKRVQTKFPFLPTKRLQRMSDKPHTRSRFMIAVKVVWAGDHPLWLFTFRDGKLISWGPDG